MRIEGRVRLYESSLRSRVKQGGMAELRHGYKVRDTHDAREVVRGHWTEARRRGEKRKREKGVAREERVDGAA